MQRGASVRTQHMRAIIAGAYSVSRTPFALDSERTGRMKAQDVAQILGHVEREFALTFREIKLRKRAANADALAPDLQGPLCA